MYKYSMLTISMLFTLISSATSQITFFEDGTSATRGDTIVLEFTPQNIASGVQAAQFTVVMQQGAFDFVSLVSDIEGLVFSEDAYNFQDSADVENFFRLVWLDQSAQVLTVPEGGVFARLTLQVLTDVDDLNSVITESESSQSIDQYFAVNGDGDRVDWMENGTLIPGDGTVNLRFLSDRQFEFEALRNGMLTYRIFQMDGRLIGQSQQEVNKGDNIVSFSPELQSNLRLATPYILSVYMDGQVSSKAFIRQ